MCVRVDVDRYGVSFGTGHGRNLQTLVAANNLQKADSQPLQVSAVQAAPTATASSDATLVCPSTGNRFCHPSHATLELESGTAKRLDKIAVGDKVRTPSGFEPVVGFLHAEKDATASFFVFETAETTMAISEKHWLFVDGVETDPARATVGQAVDTPHGPAPITAIKKERFVGAYHPITPSGAYYVDGVAASTYPAYIPHAAWKLVGDAYVTLRFRLGLPVVPEGEAPVTLFWLLDALRAAGVSDGAASTFAWPLIAASVIATEIASALLVALSTKAGVLVPSALTLALVVTPLAHKARRALA